GLSELVQCERRARLASQEHPTLAPGCGNSDLHVRLEGQLRLAAVAFHLEAVVPPVHSADGERVPGQRVLPAPALIDAALRCETRLRRFERAPEGGRPPRERIARPHARKGGAPLEGFERIHREAKLDLESKPVL